MAHFFRDPICPRNMIREITRMLFGDCLSDMSDIGDTRLFLYRRIGRRVWFGRIHCSILSRRLRHFD